MIQDMMQKFQRLSESTKNTIAADKRTKVSFKDFEAIKQEQLTTQGYMTDKINLLNARITEFDVRANRLEDHCFKKQEPIIIAVNKRFNELKTEMYYRIENFSKQITDAIESIEQHKGSLDLAKVTQQNHQEHIKKLFDEQHTMKKLAEYRWVELKQLQRDLAEIDHRYKKQLCLIKTDVPMQAAQVAHRLVLNGFKQ